MSLVRMCDCCNKQITGDFFHVKGWKNGEEGTGGPGMANITAYIIARDLCEVCWNPVKHRLTTPPPEAA